MPVVACVYVFLFPPIRRHKDVPFDFYVTVCPLTCAYLNVQFIPLGAVLGDVCLKHKRQGPAHVLTS